MRVTQIEVSYRLTESHDWSNVQVERRVLVEYPKERTPADSETIATETSMAVHARVLKATLQQDCERDVDDWLEARSQPPRFYQGPRYVAWEECYAEMILVLPLGQEPHVMGSWRRLTHDHGMRLHTIRRAIAQAVLRERIDDAWLILDTPAKVRAGEEEIDRRLRERLHHRGGRGYGFGGGPLGDYGEAGDGCDEADALSEGDEVDG